MGSILVEYPPDSKFNAKIGDGNEEGGELHACIAEHASPKAGG
jgi:hypothetical protein